MFYLENFLSFIWNEIMNLQLCLHINGHSTVATSLKALLRSFISARDVASHVMPWDTAGVLGQVILQAALPLLPPVTVKCWWHWGKKSCRIVLAVVSPGDCYSMAQTWAVHSGGRAVWCH